MRTPKSTRSIELESETDSALEQVFEALREHRAVLSPPAVHQAFANYLSCLNRELDEEDASKSRTSNPRPEPDRSRFGDQQPTDPH